MSIRKLSSEKENKIEVKIIEDFGIITEEDDKGYAKRLTIADWGRGEKYDLRPWKDFDDESKRKCGKGITLTSEELNGLLGILKKMEG